MNIVRQRMGVSPVLVIVPDNVAREVPIVPRVCRPINVNLPLAADWRSTPTRISGHDPRADKYSVRAS